MILLFGGTTEGRKAVEELEDAGRPFYYSTKTGEQSVALHNGTAVSGAMTLGTMEAFCREHDIHLLIDAAHPFAEKLHTTVATVAGKLHIPTIRYERIFPKHYDRRITWCDSYDDFNEKTQQLNNSTILATTGVQSISKLRKTGKQMFFRILRKNSSIVLAHQQGATDEELCFYGEETDRELFQRLKPDVILVKDSGESGGFNEKVAEAINEGISVYALRRPATPKVFHQVNGPHGLRRMVERLLPDFYPLKSGLTTGTCATACAIASAIRLLRGEKPSEVSVTLPNGESIPVAVAYADGYAYTMKDAGDDPDVTDGLEIRASVTINGNGKPITITGGEGIGRITLPGFDYPPGEAAINKAPREMIVRNITEQLSPTLPLAVTISAPDGGRIAQRTFNPKLGIVGGISIIGVSGIVKPFSEESFLSSIHKCMEVARASKSAMVVINSGAKSERFVKAHFPDLPAQAFVEYGNYIGATISMTAEVGFRSVTLGVMLGKAVKLAAGNLDTHSKHTTMDKSFIAQMLQECGCPPSVIERMWAMTLARELWDIVPKEQMEDFTRTVINHCMKHCRPLLPNGELTIILIDEEGKLWM